MSTLKKISVFLPSSFQNADRVEKVDGSPLPLTEFHAYVLTDAQLVDLKKEVAKEMLAKIQMLSQHEMNLWIEQTYTLQNHHLG